MEIMFGAGLSIVQGLSEVTMDFTPMVGNWIWWLLVPLLIIEIHIAGKLSCLIHMKLVSVKGWFH